MVWPLQSNESNRKQNFFIILKFIQFAKISTQLPDVTFIKVNGEDFEDLVEEYEISGYPTFALFKNGELLDTKSGKMDLNTLKQFIQSKM